MSLTESDQSIGLFTGIKNWFGGALFPNVCSFCGARIEGEGEGPLSLVCRKCHTVIPFRDYKQRKLSCMDHREYYSLQPKNRAMNPTVYAACHYEDPMRKALVCFKFHEANYLHKTLGSILYHVFSNEIRDLDFLIPIPLHPDRLRERGYNQSALIAKTIAQKSSKPLLLDCLCRTRKTFRQSEMKSKSDRVANVADAFCCKSPQKIMNCHVGVIDDVMTSGFTMYSAINAIYSAVENSQGVKGRMVVHGFVVASNR